MDTRIINITGNKYGTWTVLEYAGACKWRCQCECGVVRAVRGDGLKNGSSSSCGCSNTPLVSIKDYCDTHSVYVSGCCSCQEYEKARSLLRRRLAGRKTRSEAQKGLRLGSKLPEFVKEKISASNIGKQAGKKHWNWKGGITGWRTKLWNSGVYGAWRTSVFERDDYTCQLCNKRGGVLNVDHILPCATHPHLILEMDNARTLCKPCHLKTDTWGGRVFKLQELTT